MLMLLLASVMILSSSPPRASVESEHAVYANNDVSSVEVRTDQPSYRAGEPVMVTVVNGLAVPIYALTGQTFCTIVTLQRREDDQWNAEGRCLVLAPPGWVQISPGKTHAVEVKPRLPEDRPLAPGRHRVVLTFKVGSRDGLTATVLSPEFTISNLGGVPSMIATGSYPQDQRA